MIKRQRDFPRELVINGYVWRVRFRRRLRYEGKPAWGLCNGGTRLIELAMGMPPMKRYEIYWHEVLHALSFEHGFSLSHPTIYNLQRPLSKFITDNS